MKSLREAYNYLEYGKLNKTLLQNSYKSHFNEILNIVQTYLLINIHTVPWESDNGNNICTPMYINFIVMVIVIVIRYVASKTHISLNKTIYVSLERLFNTINLCKFKIYFFVGHTLSNHVLLSFLHSLYNTLTKCVFNLIFCYGLFYGVVLLYHCISLRSIEIDIMFLLGIVLYVGSLIVTKKTILMYLTFFTAKHHVCAIVF